jgi:membrane dipeptidase
MLQSIALRRWWKQGIAVMVFDAHSDFGLFICKEHARRKTGSLGGEHFLRLCAAGVGIEVLTVGGDFSFWGIDFSKRENVLQAIAAVKEEIRVSEGKFHLITDGSGFPNVQAGSIGILLALEGTAALSEKPGSLDEFFLQGIRSVMLTANHENLFSGGCLTPEKGLTEAGRTLLKQIEEKPMILDLAHISERSFHEISGSYAKPFIVSHANVRSISEHPRNLTDDQLSQIAAHDGVAGMSLISLFIDNNPGIRAGLDKVALHFEFAARAAGAEHVGLGPDFMDYMDDAIDGYIKEHGYPATMFSYPEGIESVADVPKVERLLAKGFLEEEKAGILFGNFERFFQRAMTGAF